jgi:nitroreductase
MTMDEAKPTKAPTRDYQALSGSPWQLWDTLYARRSHRKYLPMELDHGAASDLLSVAGLACEARGASPESIMVVTEPEKVAEVKRRAYKGLVGKINIWLGRAPLAAVLVLNLPAADVRSSRPVELMKAVMAAEDVVLWLTERGLGTCWLAGVSEREIMSATGLSNERAVPVIIVVGKPALEKPKTASFGGVSYQMMSRRRKPLGRIAAFENATVPYQAGVLRPEGFSAVQGDVTALLELLRDRKAGLTDAPPPLDLTIDACLEAGRVAPSANNSQPWLFVVVREKDRLFDLSGLCSISGGFARQAAIVVAGQRRRIESLIEKPFWAIDVPIAMSHVSLMAVSLGHAPSVLTEGIDEAGTSKLARLPKGMRVAGVIGLC